MNKAIFSCVTVMALAALSARVEVLAQAPSALVTIIPQPGMDMGQQIAACVSQLTQNGSNGGICDARAFSGNQLNTASATGSDLLIGAKGKPVELILGPVALFTNQVIKVQANSSIVGMPGVEGSGKNLFGSSIVEASNSNLGAVVELDGGLNVVQDLTIDGNANNNPTGGSGLYVNRANRVEMFRVTVQDARSHGILFASDPAGTNANGNQTGNQSCCAKLQQVTSAVNGRVGLYVTNTADLYVALSSFENNGANGIELNNSPTMRLEHSDIGGNLGNGIRMYGTASGFSSSKQIILGNQFGNNGLHDISISGPFSNSNMISSNEFIGSKRRQSGYHGIHIENSGRNTIIGNTFFSSSHPFAACIYVRGSIQHDQLIGNLCAENVAHGFVGARNVP